jgi:hypothetical protein
MSIFMTADQPDVPATVSRVIASVRLRADAEKQAKVQRFRDSDWARQPEELAEIERHILDPARITMDVTLCADLVDGRRVSGGGFGIGGIRHGTNAIWKAYRGPQLSDDPEEHQRLLEKTYHFGLSDIEDSINQMLGRDPDQHRPPRLSWYGLQQALAQAGLDVSEQHLIAAPLTIELSGEVQTEIGQRT